MPNRLDGVHLQKEFVVNLKGKDYPVWSGILDAATKGGLRALTTRIIQIPTPENGHLAVVMARAEFEDGTVWEDVGDCSPGSTSPQLAAAALRLASTRAKGRVLRDAMNVGDTMLEELPNPNDPDYTPPPQQQAAPRTHSNGGGRQDPAAGKPHPNAPVCSYKDENGACGQILTQSELQASTRATNGGRYCSTHLPIVQANG